MNLKAILTLLFITVSMNVAFASFPVQRQAKTAHTEISVSEEEEEEVYTLPKDAGKSQGIALILALTLGLLAAHRWYLNKIFAWNLMFIFTLGGLGIWLLIDIIRIIAGDLTPAKGRYKKTFF